MKFTIKIFSLCWIFVALTACHNVEDVAFETENGYPKAMKGEVRITLPEGSTRTAYDESTRAILSSDGKNILWQTGDRFTLVARDAEGKNAFSPCMFSYWLSAVEGCRSFFRGRPDATMTDGTYSYYAVYPTTAQISETTAVATFSLPAVQDGKYNGALDFMVAKGEGGALITCDDDPMTQETMNDMNITFRHQFHTLKFEIPQNGMPANIRRVHIFFSEAVAGDISVNMDSGEATTSNTTNKITVDFGEGNEKQSGDVFWAMILPQGANFTRAVDIRFEDAAGNFSSRQLVTFPQTCSKGVITPIRINAPSSVVGTTKIKYTTTNEMEQLGENVEKLHLTLPEGCYFSDYTTTHIAEEDSNGVHTFTLFDDIADLSEMRTTPLTLTFDSAHALIPTTVTLGNYTVGSETSYSKTTPWLFFEDFSGVSNFNDGHDNPRTGLGSDTYVGIIELSTKSSELTDWWATRIGVESGKVRICCRYQNVLGGKAYYKGRLYTPFLKNIKAGASVSVSVSYNYGGAYAGNSSGKGTLYLGTDSQKAPINADDTDLLGGVLSGAGYGTNVPISLSNLAINGKELPTSGGSFTSTTSTETVTVNNVTNGHRLAWIVSSTNTKSSTNANYWIYMDDIRVKIAQ